MSKSNRDQSRRERAAAVQAENARRERNRRVGILAGVVVVLALVVAAGFWYSSSSDPATTTPNSTGTPARTSGHGLTIGPTSAKTKVVVYEDFLCPYCREFELASRDYLHSDAKQGKVQVEYRPFHLLPDTYSVRALDAFAAVLTDGTPTQALKFHDLLYDRQPYEAASNKPDAAKLASWAGSVGADASAVKAAVDDNSPTYLAAAQAAASAANVEGTPTVVVNGKKLSGSPSQISDRLEQLIADQ